MDSKKTAKENREHLRQEELKQNPGRSLRDGFGNSDAGDMGWKGMALLILILFLAYVIYRFFFS